MIPAKADIRFLAGSNAKVTLVDMVFSTKPLDHPIYDI